MMKRLVIGLTALLSLWSSWSWGTVYCNANTSGRTDYVNYNVPILASNTIISALRDLPVGGVLFRQIIKNPDAASIGFQKCYTDSGNTFGEQISKTLTIEFESGAPAASSTWNGYDVYSTGVSGIGMVLLIGDYSASMPGIVFPWYSTDGWIVNLATPGQGFSNALGGMTLELLLVKTGDIANGTYTIPISLPPITFSTVLSGGTLDFGFGLGTVGGDILKDYSSRLSISGSVNIMAGTCEVPDVNVKMGTHMVGADVENTPWVDFNIKLLNCPPMYGRFDRLSSTMDATNQWLGPDSSTSGSTDQPNTLGLLFNPVSGYANLAAGGACAEFTDKESSSTAQGACLEIQNMLNKNVLTDSQAGSFTDSGLTLVQHTADYTIPLKARYARKDGETMSAGKADSAVEFTLNYQ
jgi:type 1 fimbria pilin